MRNFLSLVLICSAIPAPAAPVATPPWQVPAASTGKWVVEFENGRCTAAQAYSDGKNDIALAFQPLPTLKYFLLVVQVPGKIDGLSARKIRISMGSGDWSTEKAYVVPSTKVGHARYDIYPLRPKLEQLATSPDLRIDIESGLPIYVRLANFPAVLRTLKECEAGLLADWGLPREAQKSLESFPRPTASAFRSADYPSKALDRSAVGAIEARVTVTREGRATDCHIVRSSGHQDLDAATCANYLKRARFEPARDLSGNPIVSPYLYRVVWQLGE